MREGILEHIPVHGGITYACKDQTAYVYGFDTNHWNSDLIPGNNIEWMTGQCAKLYQGILVAAKIETAYERAQTDSARAKILQPLYDIAPDEPLNTVS